MVHKFGYLNPTTDVPNTTQTWKEALVLMKTPADIQNVPILLEGCERANRSVSVQVRNKIIRTAAANNSLHVVVECVKAAKRTGFKLNSSELVNQLLVLLQMRPINKDWNEDKTKTALKQVNLILNVLEDETHAPRGAAKGRYPLYRDPQVLAARLHLAAARAVHHQEGKDVDGKVAEYARELVMVWPEGAGLLDVHGPEAYKNSEQAKYLTEWNSFLWYASPVLSALNLAAKVVGVSDAGLGQQLQQRARVVEGEVKRALEADSRKRDGRGEAIYNKLFGPESKP